MGMGCGESQVQVLATAYISKKEKKTFLVALFPLHKPSPISHISCVWVCDCGFQEPRISI